MQLGEITKITDRKYNGKLCLSLLGLDHLSTFTLAHGLAFEEKAISMLSGVINVQTTFQSIDLVFKCTQFGLLKHSHI